MGQNSHNNSINENQKAWSKTISPDEYDIATGRRCARCKLLFPGVRGPEKKRCRHKTIPKAALAP